ncbi:MAG: GspH/FimT family protein [Clostridiales bacterium]|jgi:type II secretory pathway pseudopilin PulG|nr:GspH/FimT family protein [Clostridiales bacterium]
MNIKLNKGITLLELTVATAVMIVVLGVVVVGFSGDNSDYRALANASLTLQADMREAQRLAVMEGRRIGVIFEISQNRYHLVVDNPRTIIRTVNFKDGVRFANPTSYTGNSVYYLPRGTATPGTVELINGNYYRRITTTLSGGQVRLHDIITY